MSSVRMCDGCGKIFPEGEPGSATGTVTVMVQGQDGRTRPEQKQMDQCAECSKPRVPQQRQAIAAQSEDEDASR